MKRTNVLMALQLGAGFTWGQSIKLHEVGPYAVLEYHPWQTNGNVSYRAGTPNLNVVEFHAWIDGTDTNNSFASLDAALAGCIAYRNEGCNHRADGYFMRMIAKDTPATVSREPELLGALEDALQWIDAVPDDTTLPAMPGFDRDAVNDLIAKAKRK